LAAFSKCRGAYAKDLHKRERFDSFEKILTGRDILSILLPDKKFLAKLLRTSPKIPL